jgi:hypothetical protein
MVCDPCGEAGVKQCAPGCRTDADCGKPLTCQSGTACFTCPCATHYCALDSCIDSDNDGFVQGTGTSCSGKKGGDCDDSRADVNPGVKEVCDDGIDNNCDGLVDSADPSCPTPICAGGGGSCGNNFQCDLGSTYCTIPPGFQFGCCAFCPLIAIDCAPGFVAVSSGVDPATGCPQQTCVADTACPQNYSPVCSTSGATYGNECEATQAMATIAHAGECLPGEGVSCNPGDPTSCGSTGTLYCRDGCPFCDALFFTCMQVGACVFDYDCPAGEAPPPIQCMMGQTVHAACVNNACQYSCQ